ncbi:acyltransferase family protein [Novosphingobium humi]|uniref:Acyltransferase family protein n=1 Tax=Novosphingobium humi TaxID=2282397 RepID=A0ABY7TVE5_9SPHN|nr:acyltransferase family protein [Novosphingobium humi]WCT77227.1 acyltransferase family protein [Novosphingobium humi]
MNFRGDINGLRAIAVMAVLAFHFGFPGLGGGFAGVDVFFVISGYLMTGIIVGRLDRGVFRTTDFYLDRARRIFPPLAAMVICVLVPAAFRLLPQDLLATGKHGASAITFFSNMMFWSETGYFDQDSTLKFFLHTWSLSVEWQFYLLYPLLLLGLCRVGLRRHLLPMLAVLALASFGLCFWLSIHKPSAAFFLLPPRAWEMLIGALAYLAPAVPPRAQRPTQIAGLALIAVSIAFARAGNWPGPATLLPTLGAGLVIAAGLDRSRITGNALATWLGRNSYSIYLWHWPLAVLLTRYGKIGDHRWAAAAFALSLLLGHASWRWIEQAGAKTKGAKSYPWTAHLAYVGAMLVIAVGGAALWKTRGLPQRFSPEVRALEAEALPGGPYSKGANRCFVTGGPVPKPCLLGPGDHKKVAVTFLGDSMSENEVSALIAALPPGTDGAVAYNGYAACAPVLGGRSVNRESQCQQFLETYLAPQTKPRRTPLVLTGYWQGVIAGKTLSFDDAGKPADWPELRERLIASSCALAKGGPTYLMLPNPEFPDPVVSSLQHALIADPKAPDITMPLATYKAQVAMIVEAMEQAHRQCGVQLLDPTPMLCPDGQNCTATRGHRALIRDTHHMTEWGNRVLIPLFASIFRTGAN